MNSGVGQILTNLPQASRYIGNFEDKKQQLLNFYTRPTINWSLSCESIDKREQVLTLAQRADRANDKAQLGYKRIIDYSLVCSLLLIVFCMFALCAGAVKFTDIANGYAFIASVIIFIALTLLTVPIVVMSVGIENNFINANIATKKLNEEFIGCVDSQTIIDMDTYEKRTQTILSGASVIFLICRIVIIVQVLAPTNFFIEHEIF